jgi:hypothetical protein
MTTTTLRCESCHESTSPGLRTIRTTLAGGLVPVAWCRTCRPVVPSIPEQRRKP